MSKINGSSVKLIVGIESTPGATPASFLRLTNIVVGESLNSSATELPSQAISGDRDLAGFENGIYDVSGSVGGEVGIMGAEIFFESLLGNKVVTGIEAPYTKEYTRAPESKGLTVYRQYTNNLALKYDGAKISDMAFTFEPNALVTFSANFMGLKSGKVTTIPVSTSVVHRPTVGHQWKVYINDVETKSLRGSLNITNGTEAFDVLGSQYHDYIGDGLGEVRGEFDFYFDTDFLLYDLAKNGTEFSFRIEAEIGSRSIKMEIPRARFSGSTDATISTDKTLPVTYSLLGLTTDENQGAIKITCINELE